MPNSPGTTLTAVLATALQTSLVGPDNGENIEDDDVNDLFQKLLNGVNRTARYYLAALADLTALTDPRDGEKFLVRDFGIYEYRSASVAAVASPWIINGPGSVGRFIHTLNARMNVTDGFAKYPIANRIVGVFGGADISVINSHTGTTSEVDAASHTLSLGSLEVGDKVHVSGTFKHYISNIASYSVASISILENSLLVTGTSFISHVSNALHGAAGSTVDLGSLSFVRTVATAGPASLVVRHSTSNSSHTTYVDASNLQAIVVRP